MSTLSDDDLNLRELNDEELSRAWDLWFDLAQHTNGSDPPWTHGAFQLCGTVDAGVATLPDQPEGLKGRATRARPSGLRPTG